MKNKPYKGDWIHLVVKDFQKISVEMDETVIKNTELGNYKSLIKESVWNAFFIELQEIKLKHIKVRHIQYENTRTPQKYLTNGKMDNKSTSLLYNLRCQSTNEFKDNQHNLYGKKPLCHICSEHIDSQEKALTCEGILKELNTTEQEMFQEAKYSDLFGGEDEQLRITRVFEIVMTTRERLLGNHCRKGLPGPHNSGPD